MPHLLGRPKSMADLELFPLFIVGAKVHGRASYAYHVDGRHTHNVNVTLTVLLDVLNNISLQQPLPRTLYLLMDNCVRENKNRYVLGFLSFLIHKRVFEKVILPLWILSYIFRIK